MSGDDNLWYVKTPDGDVHRVTLDQLDEAFQAGRIDENVMVLAAGATKWAKLGELAGLDEPAQKAPAASPYTPMPPSLRPVSMDLSLDLDDNAFQKKPRKGLVVGAFLAVVAVFGGVLVANRAHVGSSDSSSTAAAAMAPTPAPQAPAAAPDPAPAPPPAATTPPADTAPKLSDEQKAKLAAADKALEQKSKARKKNRAAAGGSAPHSAKYKSMGFTTGGNKFDPLNANM